MKKKHASMIAYALAIALFFTGCSMGDTKKPGEHEVIMVASEGGINDQSFNQSTWEGLLALNKETGYKVNYLESRQASDYLTNLDRATDSKPDLVWGIGYTFSDAILRIAETNPDLNFAIADYAYPDGETPFNVTGVAFRAEESSFLAGYIAGLMTKTDKVGYIGANKSFTLMVFQYGYMAGVDYAAKERGVKIDIMVQYAESFTDIAKAKAIANKMYSEGADVIFHAAGNAGTGVIEAAKDNGKYTFGIDRDQTYMAPDNVLTSVLKNVGNAVDLVSKEKINGEDIGGKTMVFGLKEDAVGITEHKDLIPADVWEKTMQVRQKIIDGQIQVPDTEEEYNQFVANLNK